MLYGITEEEYQEARALGVLGARRPTAAEQAHAASMRAVYLHLHRMLGTCPRSDRPAIMRNIRAYAAKMDAYGVSYAVAVRT